MNQVQSNKTEAGLKITLGSILTQKAGITAFDKVRSNRGAPGVDHVSIEDIAPIFPARWKTVCESIREGRYQPQTLRRVEIPKPSGGKRKLGIPTVMDRVVQQALAQELTPLFEPNFSMASFAYRPGRHAFGAIEYVQHLLNENEFNTILHLDIQDFFDSVSHRILRKLMESKPIAPEVLDLIDRILTCGVFENHLVWQTRVGIPQGSPLSPLLANIFLDQLDSWVSNRHFAFARYADDMVILLPTAAVGRQLIEDIAEYLNRNLELSLNREKTWLARWTQVEFLGFSFRRNSNGLAQRCVSRTSLMDCRAEIDQLTDPASGALIAIEKVLADFLSGWIAYYRHTEDFEDIRTIYGYARDRVRQIRWVGWATDGDRRNALSRLGIDSGRAAQFAKTPPPAIAGSFDEATLAMLREAMPDTSFLQWGLAEDLVQHDRKSKSKKGSHRIGYCGKVQPTRQNNARGPGIDWLATASCWMQRLFHSRFIRFRLETCKRPNSILPRPNAIGVSIGSFYFRFRL